MKYSSTQITYFTFAAMASVPLSVNDPIKCNDNNVNSTIKLLTAAKNQNVKKK